MIDSLEASLRFERFLMGAGSGYDPNEPRDDRKSYDDMARYGRRKSLRDNSNEGTPVCNTRFDPVLGQMVFEPLSK